MRKTIKYFSAKDFKNYLKSFGFSNFSFNHSEDGKLLLFKCKDYAFISIGNVEIEEDVNNDVDLWANGPTNHWLPDSDNVLNIDFADVDDSGNMKYKNAITEEQAKTIVDFIDRNNKSVFIIHCGAGISRSGAVAKYIFDCIDGQEERKENDEFFIFPEYPTCPNYYVYSMLKQYKQKKENEK